MQWPAEMEQHDKLWEFHNIYMMSIYSASAIALGVKLRSQVGQAVEAAKDPSDEERAKQLLSGERARSEDEEE